MNSIELLSKYTTLKDKRYAFYAKGIKSTYSNDRIIFYPRNRGGNNITDVIVRECNGLIISLNDNKPLVIPPQLLSYNTNYSFVNEHIEEYNIVKAQDGTIINLYWWDGWKISTTRGYDVTNIIWNTDTYEKIFSSILENTYNTSLDEFYKKLNKTHCYSWIINHPDFHPFNAKENKHGCIWFVQSCNMDNLSISTISPIDNIPPQEQIYLVNPTNNEKINIHCLGAECDKALDTYIKKGEILFGYVLRSKNPAVTKGHSNILLESTLMAKIRKLFYDKKYKTIADNNGYNRNNCIILHNYIHLSNNKLFQLLFPQYKEEFERLDNKINVILKYIIREYQNRNSINIIQESKTEESSEKKNILEIIKFIDIYLNVNIDNKDHIELIKQCIKSPNNYKILYGLCF